MTTLNERFAAAHLADDHAIGTQAHRGVDEFGQAPPDVVEDHADQRLGVPDVLGRHHRVQ